MQRSAVLPDLRRSNNRSREQHPQRGSVLVEMALVMPLFVTLIFGTIEVAIMLYDYCAADFACRAATRYASLHSNTSGDPTTQAQIQAIVTANLIQINAGTPTVLLFYGDRRSGGSGSNIVGDLVGVGVIWVESTPWLPNGQSIYLTAESYRVVSR
jgi:hypothetical protein